MITIRAGRPDDFSRLADIELDAFIVWAKACEVSLEPSATPDHLLKQGMEEGLLLVAEELDTERVVGFAAGFVAERHLYIAEVDVERASQGQGIGRSLMQAILTKGRECGLCSAVLTTDRYAPFNAPFYSRLGFSIIDETTAPGFLRERLQRQIASGLDPQRRVAMQASLQDVS